MKRPFGVTGLSYLVTLAAVFHFYSQALVTGIVCAAAVASVIAVLARLVNKNIKAHIGIIATALSCLAAVVSLFLYQNFIIDPIVSSYAGKQIRAEGYIDEDISFKNSLVTYVLHAEKIDGGDCDVKISFTAVGTYDLEPFDKIAVTLNPVKADYSYSLSRKIFLRAYEGDNSNLTITGEKHTSLYTAAVSVRKMMRNALNDSLDGDAADLARAVLLGEKQALSDDIKDAFNVTGTSYLIVVSGMHLAVVTLLLRRIFEKIGSARIIPFVLITIFILAYMAITGFAPSVMRAGIMMIVVYLGKLFLRDPDGINSLGIAALILTVPNPYAVGDVGMLLSFAATAGIILWADKISGFCLEKLSLNNPKPLSAEKSFTDKLKNLLKRPVRWIITLFAVSLSATIWVIPVTVLLLGKISPLTVIISLFAYPLACALLLMSMALVMLRAALPFISVWKYIFAPPIELVSAWLVAVIKFFSKLPFCSVGTDKTFYYIWIAVSAALTAAGYIIHGKRLYIFSAVTISALTLAIGGSVTYLTADYSSVLTVYRFGNAYTVMVQKGDNISLLSCGSDASGKRALMNELKDTEKLDDIIITSKHSRNVSFCSGLLSEFEAENIFVSEGHFEKRKIPAENVSIIRKNTSFTLELNSDTEVEAANISGTVYQFVSGTDTSVLIVPENAKLSTLPENMRLADVAIFEGRAYETDLLQAERMLSLSDKANDLEIIPDGAKLQIKLSK